MYDTKDILEAARSIRPFLAELLGPDSNDADLTLASYLARSEQGEKVDNIILDFLCREENTRVWTRTFLDQGNSPALRSYSSTPGSGSPVQIGKYRCPKNDYVWFRRNEEIDVPKCPTHDLALERSSNR